MKYTEARQGRIFVIRLEDGDVVHEAIEELARKKRVRAAVLIVVGGADKGSKLVVGPRKARAKPIVPVHLVLREVHEVAGVGTLFPDDHGQPEVHLHMACGRGAKAVTGCIREGVKVWHVMEVIMIELLGTRATRRLDRETGFKLMQP